MRNLARKYSFSACNLESIVAALGHGGDGARIAARITRKSLEKLDLREGSEVFAQIKSVALGASGAGR
jgi:molybdate transport system ATP-binding protein